MLKKLLDDSGTLRQKQLNQVRQLIELDRLIEEERLRLIAAKETSPSRCYLVWLDVRQQLEREFASMCQSSPTSIANDRLSPTNDSRHHGRNLNLVWSTTFFGDNHKISPLGNQRPPSDSFSATGSLSV